MIDEKKLIEDIENETKCMNAEKEEYFKCGNFHNGNIIVEKISAIKIIKKIINGQPKTGDWIPCSEPPKHDREVLIFNGKSYSVGYYDGKTWINAIHPVEWQEIHHE